MIVPADGEEFTLVDEDGKVLARSTREVIDDSARQRLSEEEIAELKRKGTGAGKEIVAKLLLSHTAIDQKTAFSLAKYKLLKERKYVRRFTVLPLDVPLLAQWMLEDKDASKILEMRQEAMALIGCWADVRFGGVPVEGETGPHGGRWLVVDDTAGLLTATLAERMGILHREEQAEATEAQDEPMNGDANDDNAEETKTFKHGRKRPRRDDLDEHYALTNTITLVSSNGQPNLSLLRYFDFDASDPNPSYPYHPLFTNLLPITWLQLIQPEEDPTYAERPADVTPEELASWKTNRRGNYHRKRRRWARAKQIVDNSRAGNFTGLAVASTMDPISILRNTLPLLAGGSPVAIYSPSIEPLTQLADCFSIGRRGAWVNSPPPENRDKSPAELESWPGSEDFPINPTLLMGASIQSSRARPWQVLPGRTHPLMMGRGGAEGYLFTGWKALPAGGKIAARGKYQKKKAEAS